MWQIRPARATDISAIDGLVAAAGGDQEDLREDQFTVADGDDGAILGCGRLKPYHGFCELASLAVAEEMRAKGVGREIVTSLLGRYQGPIYLICEDGVVDFFGRFGFGLLPETDMPAGLRPKWDCFCVQAGHMNVMRRD